MAMTAMRPDEVRTLDLGRCDEDDLLAAAEPRSDEHRPVRLAALMDRAARRRCTGGLLSALSSGLLSGDLDQTEALYQLATEVDGDALQRRRALSSLMTLARLGEPGALAVLAWLEDERSAEALAAMVRESGRRSAARVAAVRGVLFVLRVPGAAGSRAGMLLESALRDASGDDDPAVRYSAAFVRASLGHRAVRGCLERGALEEADPDLLRLCLLGIEAIGDAMSLPFVWRVWMRQPVLRDLADAVSERLEEDLRRRQVNLLEGSAEPPRVEVVAAPATSAGRSMREVVVH